MELLNKHELMEIKGGFGAWSFIGIISGITFIIGIIDGYVRPLRCN